jgi:hypothetical protein
VGDRRGLRIEAGETARCPGDEPERRPSGSAAHVDHPRARVEAQERGDLGLLGGRAPSLLADVFAVDLAAHLGGERAREARVLRPVEIEPARRLSIPGHEQTLPRSRTDPA